MKNINESNNSTSSDRDSGFINLALSGGIGFLLGSQSKKGGGQTDTPVVTFPGYLTYLDGIMATLDQAQLISFTMNLIKCTYLRSLLYLDNEYKIQKDRRTRRHLINCASKSLKTPFNTKVVVYSITGGFSQSLLLSDGSYSVKDVKIVPNPKNTFIKHGVTDILSTILSSDPDDDEISIMSGRRVGSHGRFNLSPRTTLFEALAFGNKPVSDFEALQTALSLYYAALLSNLSSHSRAVVLGESFQLKGFVTLNYKDDGCGYLTNFRSHY